MPINGKKVIKKVTHMDLETGEILFQDQEFISGRTIIKEGCIESNKRHGYTKIFEYVPDPKLKSRTFIGYFYTLTKYLSKNSNIVITHKHGYATNANNRDIADMLKISYTYADKFLVDCVKAKVMAKVKFGKNINYIVNPAYAFKGSEMNISMYEQFRTSLDFLLTLKSSDKLEIQRLYDDNVNLKISIELGRSYVDEDGNTQYTAITPSDLIKIKKQNMIDNCKRS